MTIKPRDVPDLLLAPVALELDARLERCGRMSPADLEHEVVLAANRDAKTHHERRADLLLLLTQNAQLHDWTVEWDPRGVRMRHDDHALVLGLPPSALEYLNAAPATHQSEVGH